MRKKTGIFGSRRVVKYSKEHWNVLAFKRKRALEVMERLVRFNLKPILYGSVARGDVNLSSDVDIFIPEKVPSYKIEVALDVFDVLKRRVIQATPNYAIKGEILLEDSTTVSFPLVRMREREMDFYKFGGAIDYEAVIRNKRVSGVDKRLILIIPTREGHEEIPLNEIQPNEMARILGVGIEIVEERIRVLERRGKVGRTGVFLCESVQSDESFELALKAVAERNPAVKRRLNEN
jgi:hypothetical protein